jgi:hypothetical protein
MVQAVRSEGVVQTSLFSADGGFDFLGTGATGTADENANAYRADLSVGFGDLFEDARGRLTLYAQRLEAGYSAPGSSALTETDLYGGTFGVPIASSLELTAKADRQVQDDGLRTTIGEVDVAYHIGDWWTLSAGARHDRREDDSLFVPETQDEGERTDGVVELGFDTQASWRAYTFAQATLQRTDDRDENNRAGAGGAYRVNDRLALDGEVSHGDLGTAVKLGTSFQETEDTHRYLTYTLENEEGQSNLPGRRGTLISGARSRLSDSGSAYVEDRYQHAGPSNGLTRSMGVNLAPADRWSVAANWELGTLIDRRTNAETKRRAGGASVGYAFDGLRLSTGIEYRFDETEQLDGSWSDRTTWLFRHNMKFQMTPDVRLIGKLNHSFSDSSEGDFYDGGFTELVGGFAVRPVKHDRLNLLAKYTYFYNVPTTDQVSVEGTSAEFIQKSHIGALDVSYDLTRWWTLGGKYAYRRGEVSLDREDHDFFSNDAHLYILRNDFRFLKSWETSVEGRMLHLPDLDERRTGALLVLYRYFGEHFKVGVGYNFTDYSDDLTDLDYDDHGWFLNLIGTL